MFLSPDHFRRHEDINMAANLFKLTVATVEVEIHSYCNRVCSFCPNSFIDRRHNKTDMDAALYSKIMDDLAVIDFSGIVWYSRYNEPTADRDLFIARLKEARAKLPHVKLQTYTNGDFLDADYIGALRDAGLNELRIMAYLAPKEEATHEKLVQTTLDRLHKLGLPYQFVEDGMYRVDVPGILVTYNFADLVTVGTDRGGTLETGFAPKRLSPCAMPLTGVYIDYSGAMVPCCDVRSDYEGHKDCIVYRLTPQNSIFHGYANSALVEWRRSVLRYGEKGGPCSKCSRWLMKMTPESVDTYEQIARIADDVCAMEEERRKAAAQG